MLTMNIDDNLSKKTFISCIVGKRTVFTDISRAYPKNSKLISEELKRIDPNIQSLDEIIDFIEKDKKGYL